MKVLTNIVLVFVLGLTCSYAQETKNIKSTGAISGTITLNGKPLVGAYVSAQPFRRAFFVERTHLSAITDLDGKFRISNINPGTYLLAANLPGFVASDSSQKERTIVVTGGETVENADFALTRGSVISGRVHDPEGRPVIGEYVRLIPTDSKLEWIVQSLPGDLFATDDRGIYRVYGLPAGTYKVAIGDDTGFYASLEGRRPFPQTFHKDAKEESKARLVEVAAQSEVTNVDIEVGSRMELFAISGKILDAQTGAPLSGVHFGLTRTKEGHSSFSEAGVSNSSGSFQLDNVPAGRYVATLLPGKESFYYGESEPFDLIAGDVTDIEIKALRAASISGVIGLEGTEDKTVIAMLPQLQLHLMVRGSTAGGGGYSRYIQSSINADGTFRSGGVPSGIAYLNLGFPSVDYEKFAILRIERDGVEQTQGLKIKDGEQISGLRVVVGYGTGGLRGIVKLVNGDFSPKLYFFAQLYRNAASDARPVKGAQVDARGRFLFESLPPGNYQLLVRAYNSEGETPVTIRQQVAIADRVVSEVSVSIDLKGGSTPKP